MNYFYLQCDHAPTPMNHFQYYEVLYNVLFYEFSNFCKLFLLRFIIFHNLWGPSKFHCDLWLTFICQMPGSVHQPWIITDYRRVLYIPYYMTITYHIVCIYIHQDLHAIQWYTFIPYLLHDVRHLHILNMTFILTRVYYEYIYWWFNALEDISGTTKYNYNFY